jgi:membrane fusion protein, multidrug efflux system
MAEPHSPSKPQAKKGRNNRFKWPYLLTLLLFGAIFVTIYWWLFMRHRVSTDNAYVKADIAMVASRVPGTIAQLLVDNDAFVTMGSILLELDPNDYRTEVDRKRSALARTEADIRVSEVTVEHTESITQAQVDIAESMLKATRDREQEARHRLSELQQYRAAAAAEHSQTKRDYERYSNLHKEGAGSQQQRDKSSTAYKKSTAQLEAVDAQIAAARASLAAIIQDIQQAKAQLESALADRLEVEVEKNRLASLSAKRSEMQAELRTAELSLSYCTVRAPISGYIAQRRIQIGDRIQPGQALLAIVPLHEVYVEANFKETELQDVRLGQPAAIHADLYPKHTYYGKVVGIRAGTGAAFSLLPPENATGNWIKVVQRVPVKIKLDSPPPVEFPLRVGLSLDVTISTEDQSGPRLVGEKLFEESARVASQ